MSGDISNKWLLCLLVSIILCIPSIAVNLVWFLIVYQTKVAKPSSYQAEIIGAKPISK